MPYLTFIPKLYQALKPGFIWRLSADASKPTIYLTFDDGPIPAVTPWVLAQLKAYQAKATFFCIGDNVQKHPEVYNAVLEAGHSVGNHTFNHLKGSKHSLEEYLANFNLCANLVRSKGFRPPYGRIQTKQARAIRRAGYDIIMWDSLATDWDAKRSGQQCFESVRKHAGSGSIVVFHDSIKAWPRLKEALPLCLDYYSKLGYRFEALKLQNNSVAE
ncbi:polysaccharide deacetylase family protein [Croceimicrobium sp.]|uniref:polysaccharide deacetylase family protein n=1 Tax=Croceimicrobium sp. TaxID=2828340 RepID=UPI003BAD9DBB